MHSASVMPCSGGSVHWSLTELFGQRKLLGLGALLAWVVLFHLLVNVWLLCIFTSLLVVFGGWLGSRAALDANSLLHLEHFLPLGKINPHVHSPEQEWRLNHEIHSAVHKAVRDFVSSWYRTLLPEVEGEFERAVRNSMLDSVMELKERAQRVDRKALVQRLLELYGCHLQSYMAVRQIQSTQRESTALWQLYSDVESPHPAVSSATAELSYSRAMVNLVLHILVPYPQMETRTGGYMVTELITCNVFLTLISRISDPDWLNQTIVDLFTKSKEPQGIKENLPANVFYKCQKQQESWTTCRSLSSDDQAGFFNQSLSDAEDFKSQSSLSVMDLSQSSLTSAEKVLSCHARLRPPLNVNCCSNSTMSKIISMDSLIPSDSEDDPSGGFCECSPSTKFCSLFLVKDDEPFGFLGPLRNLGPKAAVPDYSQWPAGIAQEKTPACPGQKHCPTPFNFEATSNPTATRTIQTIQISGTVSASEQRSTGTHPYTLYTIKFETLPDGNSAGNEQTAASHTVNRRYSEFLNLQTRIEEKPEMKKFIKNIRGPKKMFPDLQFGCPDSDKVEARKSQLDAFLKQLSSIPETANSDDMQEFLCINSDVCSYFGRKPFSKSRIDKMMENALDTLRTAFPHPELLSPVEDVEGYNEGRTMDNRKYRRLFPSKVSPALNIPDLHPKVTYCYSEGSSVLNNMSLSGLESFVREQERLLSGTETTRQSSDLHGKESKMTGRTHGTDTAVADVALNILCLLMKDQWSWLCTENIQKAIRLLFGTFIERWLEVGTAHLTSEHCWVIYLQVLQEAVWPGGMLPAQPQPERSAAEREETKEQCLHCLMQLLPEFIAEMLGCEKYKMSLETMLGSLQDHQINKHLIFCICDLLLEFLIPESCDESLQRSLLQSLTKDTERDSPRV